MLARVQVLTCDMIAQTHAQTSASNPGLAGSLRILAQRGGLRALFAGVGPRTARSAGAYAILMASYDLISRSLTRLHDGRIL